ncbi:hypothetical protein Tco_0701703 [Tanacetum coccineum]
MRNRINLHTARDDSLLGTLKYVSKTEEYQVYGALIPKEILNEDILNSTAYQTYYTYVNGAKETKKAMKFKKPASLKLNIVPVSPKEPNKKPAKGKKYVSQTRKPATKPKPTKKKASVKADRGKGLNVLSAVALSETAQLKEATKRSKRDEDKNDDDDEADSDRTELDRIHTPEDYELTDEEDNADNVKEKNKEEKDDVKELYRDVNVNLRKEDVEMTEADLGGADQHNVSQELGSSVSSDFTDKLLNFKNTSPTDNVIASLMDTTIRHEEPSSHTSSLFTVLVTVILEITSAFTITIPPPPPSFNPLPQQATPTPTPTTSEITTSFPALLDFSSVFKFNDRVANLEKDLSKMNQVDRDPKSKESKSTSSSKGTSHLQHKSSGKSAHAEEPSHTVDDSGVQQNQEFDTGNNDEQPDDEAASKVDWYKKPEQPPTPDPDWDKRQHVDFRPPQTWISNIARAEKPPTSFDELMDTPIDFSAFVMNRLNITNLTQELLVGPAFNLLKGTCKSRTELEYHFEECFKATTERLDWHNPKGKPYPFDLRKRFPLISDHQGHQVIPLDYFINNDLEYLKGGSLSRQYSTSITKIKAATYKVKWIEDMVPNLWSPMKVVYDKHAYWGTSHWGPKHQQFYRFASHMTSSKDVYSRKRMIAVTKLKIMRWYDYGHLDKIEVRREDQQLYTFKEGDFP